ncbi:MAG: DUF3299 domain-containing protein, partial [Planctomycetes bacterium]|nr:DUF3299 domain-containing protein [Planctomycetota bacterium]
PAFDELAGRATPPDRAERILARIAAGPRRVASRPRWSRPLVAAMLLLGLGVTIALAVSEGDGDGGSGGVAGGDSHQVSQQQQVSEPSGQVAKELPKGTDPADLAAMRSAEAMLAAEQKLEQMIAAGEIVGVDRVLPFERLSGWPYQDGLRGAPADVLAFDGEQVLMLGFMLPLDEVEGMREFLLVSSLWSCCYGTPPNVNGIVRCRMAEDRRVDYLFEPIKVVGRFSVGETRQDGYCVDVYQLEVELLEVVK